MFARSKPAPSPLQARLVGCAIALSALFLYDITHAAPLPVTLTGIKIEVLKKPDPPIWHTVGWVEEVEQDTTHAYIYYTGDELFDEEGEANSYVIDLKFTAEDGYSIKSVGQQTFKAPGVKTYTLRGLVVRANTKPAIPFTLIDGSEQETGGVVHVLPVLTKVVKAGEATAPSDGLVVKKSDVLRYRLSPALPDHPVILVEKVQWHWRILKWDGTFSEWTEFKKGQGHTFLEEPKDAGIYELKADIDTDAFYYVRAKDDPHSARLKNEHDCFGVVGEQWQINVRNVVKSDLGSTVYKKAGVVGQFPGAVWKAKSDKCNAFVFHKATAGGAPVPIINGIRNPPLANQWAGILAKGQTEIKEIKKWTLLPIESYPQPGFIVARGKTGGTGHTGFIDYDGAWIGAGELNVNRKADLQDIYSYRSGTASYQPARFRKFTP